MAFDVWKASDYAWVAETAEEELHLLESHHPQHFDSLKHEVAALLSEARSLLVLLPSATTCPSSSKPPSSSSQPADVESTSSASASSSNRIVRKRKCVDGGREVCVQLTIPERETCECSGGGEWMDSSDVALEKAKACLHRIREVKKDIRQLQKISSRKHNKQFNLINLGKFDVLDLWVDENLVILQNENAELINIAAAAQELDDKEPAYIGDDIYVIGHEEEEEDDDE